MIMVRGKVRETVTLNTSQTLTHEPKPLNNTIISKTAAARNIDRNKTTALTRRGGGGSTQCAAVTIRQLLSLRRRNEGGGRRGEGREDGEKVERNCQFFLFFTPAAVTT